MVADIGTVVTVEKRMDLSMLWHRSYQKCYHLNYSTVGDIYKSDF